MLPGNSVTKVISWKNKPIFTGNKSSVYKTKQFHMVKGIINASDHMQFSLVIHRTIGDNWAGTWPPIIATWYVSFATTFNTSQVARRDTHRKC